MTERLDKVGLTEWMNSVESQLEDIRRFARQTRVEVRDQTALLLRIAEATESIDAKTKDKGK
jgi:hypothetical protein